MITKTGMQVLAADNGSDKKSKRPGWVVPAAVLGGTALGAGALYGLNQAGYLGNPIDLADKAKSVGAWIADKWSGAPAIASEGGLADAINNGAMGNPTIPVAPYIRPLVNGSNGGIADLINNGAFAGPFSR